MNDKLTIFTLDNYSNPVKYVETQTVKAGVECDIYEFIDDNTKDLAIVRVAAGFKTPRQLVHKGDKTIEGYVSGDAILTVQTSTETKVYKFGKGLANAAIIVGKGDVMQWQAESNLVFYEICEPPYEDGRFENLPE